MDPLSVTASIIAITKLLTNALGYLDDVTNASNVRTQWRTEILNLNSLLYRLTARIEEEKLEKQWFAEIKALATENGPLDQFKQLLEVMSAQTSGSSRMKRFGQTLMWKSKKDEVNGVLAQIERLKSLVGIALQMDHFKLSQAMKGTIDCMHSNVLAVQTEVECVREEQQIANRQKIAEWISPGTDYPGQQSDIIGRRQEGTGLWFLGASEFSTWLNEPKGTLFCPGIPGAGKTMIAAIVVDHLLKERHNNSVAIAYIYCNYKRQEEQSFLHMLEAILKQLVVQGRPSVVKPAEELYQKYLTKATRPTLEHITDTLKRALAEYSTTYIIIDALDECRETNRQSFLNKIWDLQAKADVRLMATSRSIPSVENQFKGAMALRISADNEDVRRFVTGHMSRMSKCIQGDLVLQEMVREKVVEVVDGMFLLARLQMDSLQDKRTSRKVQEALKKISKDAKGPNPLDIAYKNALERIESQLADDRELAKKTLSWITCAKRPLSVPELLCALAVEPNDTSLDRDNVLDVEELLSVCAGLVVVDSGTRVIRLVHFTTQEYFERTRDDWNQHAELQVASTCLTYLSFDLFQELCSSNSDLSKRSRENELLYYAAKYWAEHIRPAEHDECLDMNGQKKCPRRVEHEVCDLACSFLTQIQLVASAAEILAGEVLNAEILIDQSWNRRRPKNLWLHLLAQFDLSFLATMIIARRQVEIATALNCRDNWGDTPLEIAATFGHIKMVRCLLQENPNADDISSSLWWASYRGHDKVVEMLLEYGADHNNDSLISASASGHGHTVRLLLEHGADVNARSPGYCYYALQAASERGHGEIVKLLLEKGANVHPQGGWGRCYSPLCVAAGKGYTQIAKLLLDKGADVNARDRYQDSALKLARRRGHKEIIDLLIGSGAIDDEQVVKSG